jgi:hypothetical protein
MNGWIWQWYATEPAALKVWENVAPARMTPLLGNSSLSGLTVWFIPVWLVHSTTSPTLIVRLLGSNANGGALMATLWVSAISSSLAGRFCGTLAAAIQKLTLNHIPGRLSSEVHFPRKSGKNIIVKGVHAEI